MHPALLKAYRQTCYEAAGIKISIGRRCAAMDRLLIAHGSQAAVFITAYNPFSRVMPLGWNQRMQTRLLLAVRRRPVLSATGYLRRWTEAHLLVFGDARPMQRLARRYRQYATVIVRLRQPPQLTLTFEWWAAPIRLGASAKVSGGGASAEAGLVRLLQSEFKKSI